MNKQYERASQHTGCRTPVRVPPLPDHWSHPRTTKLTSSAGSRTLAAYHRRARSVFGRVPRECTHIGRRYAMNMRSTHTVLTMATLEQQKTHTVGDIHQAACDMIDYQPMDRRRYSCGCSNTSSRSTRGPCDFRFTGRCASVVCMTADIHTTMIWWDAHTHIEHTSCNVC